jgi:tRNA modification GTPase
MNYKVNDGIFAQISGGLGSSVTVIRISAENQNILKVCNALKINTKKLNPNFTFLSKIFKNNEFLDKALITYFQAPNSFTGEDCIEIAIHGSSFIYQEILEVLISQGLRFASNGEFSYRAFLNGKIDLVEAEGIASLVASSTKIQHLSAQRQFLGEDSKVFISLRNDILDILAFIETLIDFSDEELPEDIIKNLESKIEFIRNKIQNYIHNTSIISLQEGLKVAIIGEPNVGKSSIFNKFCKREKAIVSNIEGTTRDVLEEKIILKGIPVYFYDTAGIRSSIDEVENEGIKRAIQTLQKSDIKLLVKTQNDNKTFADLAKNFNFDIDKNTIFVVNKVDDGFVNDDNSIFNISALNGNGFNALIDKIEQLLETNFLPLIKEGLISTERQKLKLLEVISILNRFDINNEIELVSEDLRIASKLLEEIVGKIDIEDILGSIFSKFCIGK